MFDIKKKVILDRYQRVYRKYIYKITRHYNIDYHNHMHGTNIKLELLLCSVHYYIILL